MFFKDQCKYYAPCGLCTHYDKPCNTICKQKDARMKSNCTDVNSQKIKKEQIQTMKPKQVLEDRRG